MRDLGITLPKLPLRRVDLTVETGGLPSSLIAAIEAEGGLWSAGDVHTSADEVVETAGRVGAVALRLDFRDLALLERLPGIRYLHVRSDGRPPLDPIASLTGLRALILETSALRGDLDPLAFAPLRSLQRLRYARLELTDIDSLEPVRDHPAVRMVAFAMAQELDLSVLASIRGLKAVRRGKRFERPAPWPELGELAADDPLRVEWSRAMAE